MDEGEVFEDKGQVGQHRGLCASSIDLPGGRGGTVGAPSVATTNPRGGQEVTVVGEIARRVED